MQTNLALGAPPLRVVHLLQMLRRVNSDTTGVCTLQGLD
jgi:hypothetical protein